MALLEFKICGRRSPVNEGDLQKNSQTQKESRLAPPTRFLSANFSIFVGLLPLLLFLCGNCSTATSSGNSPGCEVKGVSCGLTERCDDDVGCVPLLACGPDNCDGCCSNNQCIRPGDTDRACGMGGDPCLNCERAGSSCQGATCGLRCDPSNCAGCCDLVSGRCLSYSQQEAESVCGEEGGFCSPCGASERCSRGECVEDLCRNTCEGCCDGEVCILDPQAGCGLGGAACQECGDGRCSDGICVSAQCSEQCRDGCCDDDGSCESGNRNDSCGTDGNSCRPCDEDEECVFGQCELRLSLGWRIVVESAEVSIRDENEELWDLVGLPDLYVQIELGDGENQVTASTTRLWNGLVFDFLGEEIISDVSTETILRGFQVTWFDWDLVNSDDPMHQATQHHSPDDFSGDLLSLESGDFKLYYRLLPVIER